MKRGAATDGNTLRTQRTVERILAGSLALFNARGEGNVTTGMIADSLDMSPGNLYYHFRNKEQIVEALFRRFEERMGVEPRGSPDAAQALEDLWLYLHLALETIWEYRFIYRNLDDLLARNRRLREVYNRIVDRKLAAFGKLCDDLVAAQAMRATPEEIRALGRNVVVVATYWLNYQSIRRRRDDVSAEDLGQGAYQVMALVAPFLQGRARAHLDALGARYIE
jgi:AcrR family transcriptional regulator